VRERSRFLSPKAEFLAQIALSRTTSANWNGNVDAQQEPNWYIDWLRGNDANAGTTPDTPVQTIMGGVVPRWGTNAPAFFKSSALSTVRLNILSTPPGGEDVWLEPIKFGGVNLGILATKNVLATTTIAALTPKSYTVPANSGTLLAITVSSGVAAMVAANKPLRGVFVRNLSKSQSLAQVAGISGNVLTMSQPLNPPNWPAVFYDFPIENDSWAPGDTIVVEAALDMNLKLNSRGGDALPAFGGGGTFVQGINVPRIATDSEAGSFTFIDFSEDFFGQYVECSFQPAGIMGTNAYAINCSSPSIWSVAGIQSGLFGGKWQYLEMKGSDVYMDCDIIADWEMSGVPTFVGRNYMPSGGVCISRANFLESISTPYPILWGPGTIQTDACGALLLSPFAGVPGNSWEACLLNGGLQIEASPNGTTFGGTPGATLVTPANLDAAPGKMLYNPYTGARFAIAYNGD
jgi:hypothetical protein